MSIRDIINNDLHRYIALYLDDRSLCRWTQTCRAMWIFESELTEDAWQLLCEKRWLKYNNLLRSVGASSYKVAYQLLSFRKLPPRGRGTQKWNRVFGFGCSDGVSIWVYLDHSVDCCPRQRRINGSIAKIVSVRLCIQNNRHPSVLIPYNYLDTSGYHLNWLRVMKKFESGDFMNMRSKCYNVKLKAFNGEEIPEDVNSTFPFMHQIDEDNIFEDENSNMRTNDHGSILILKCFDSIVLSVDVVCPEHIEDEVEFLSSIHHIAVSCAANVSYPNQHKRKVAVTCHMIDEDRLWDYYLLLPRGMVVLKEATDKSDVW